MLSLVIVSKGLAPYRARFYDEVARSLARSGWQVTLLVAKSEAEDHPWKNAGIHNPFFDIVEVPFSGRLSKAKKWLEKIVKKSIALPSPDLFELLGATRPAIVWTHEYSPFCLAAAIWAAQKDCISIVSTDLGKSPPPYACGPKQLRFQRLWSFLYQGVIAQTMDATRRAEDASTPIHFSPHAIDTREYRPALAKRGEIFRFLFTGALTHRKGLDVLLAAGRLLESFTRNRFEIRVIGSGPLESWLDEHSYPWLSFGGFREGSELLEEYQSAHAYVLPTRGDTYAVTVHEAAACELPLIVGHGAGAAETLVREGISGFTIDPEDIGILAARMQLLLDHPDQSTSIGKQARELALAFDVKKLGRQTADFLIRQCGCRTGMFQDVGGPTAGTHETSATHPITAERTAAVFCTMNRAAVAEECLCRLASQTTALGKTFVTDNASSDGTRDVLAATANRLGISFDLIASSENLGNAGGVHLAIERAFSEGFTHVWILDDDSWPESSAFGSLIAEDGPKEGIRTSIVLVPDSEDVSWPCEVATPSGPDWHTLENLSQIIGQPWTRIRRSWLGSLIPKEAYEVAGPVNPDLFLRGEDEDLPRSLEAAGFPFWITARSVLRHPAAGPLVMLNIGENKLALERNLTGDKLYYRIRNMLWIKQRESGNLTMMILGIGYFLLLLRWFRPLIPALRVFFDAAIDAHTGRLGKRPLP